MKAWHCLRPALAQTCRSMTCLLSAAHPPGTDQIVTKHSTSIALIPAQVVDVTFKRYAQPALADPAADVQ